MKYLFIGLGNIGAEYNNTRHNIGFDVVDELAKQFDAPFKVEKLASIAEFKYAGKQIYLAKPTTFMNLSGKAFQYWMQQLKIELSNIVVIVDDLSLPLGKLRFRGKGSSAGHNGMKSIEQTLGNNNYNRLRYGIGNDFLPGRQIEFVLGKWKPNEETEVAIACKEAADALIYFVKNGLNNTMTKYNQS